MYNVQPAHNFFLKFTLHPLTKSSVVVVYFSGGHVTCKTAPVVVEKPNTNIGSGSDVGEVWVRCSPGAPIKSYKFGALTILLYLNLDTQKKFYL